MLGSGLNINNAFFTLQGEGLYAGTRALFVRMPFCNLKCGWCDTEFNTFKTWTEKEFRDFAESESCRFAVITGGEPMMNKHTPKVAEILRELGYRVATETNGCYPITSGIDFVTCSPKREQKIPYYVHPDAWPRINEFKYVVDKEFDWTILERHRHLPIHLVRLSLSPEFGTFKESVAQIIDYIKENPQWKLSLQTHKFIGIP